MWARVRPLFLSTFKQQMSKHSLPSSPRSSSHSRSPSSSAPSQAGNTLESLSRTISSLKSYVPSVPSGTLKSYVPSLKTYAEPSPPSVSRPLSFATFSAAGEVEEGSARGRGRGRSRGIRGDAYQREEYVDFQGDTYERDRSEGAPRGSAGRDDEDLYWDQQREVSLDKRPRPRQEFERDYELDQDFDGYVRGSDAEGREGGEVEARERVTGEDQADTDLIRWTEGGDEPLLREEEDGPWSNREEDGEDRPPRVDELLHQVEDIPSRRSEQDGPSRRSEQIAPPSWRVPSRREGQDMERRHVRQKTVVPPNSQQTALPSRQQTSVPPNPQQTAVLPSRQQTIVPGRHTALLLDRQRTIVAGKHAVLEREDEEEEDTPVLEFARQGSGLAQVMRGVAGQASDRRGIADRGTTAGAADAPSARGSPSGRGGQPRPGPAVVDLDEEDESAQGIVDLGAEEIRTTAGGEGGAKHAYAHPAREADLISWARWDLLGDK